MSPVPGLLAEALRDRYTIERELGRGGMATVYLARDLRHHRLVALKILHPELAVTLGPERFRREIETAANLSHPHILPLFDSGEAGGLLWYSMPYVEGESLRQRLTREAQAPVEEALGLVREVLDALSYAHAHGVIHRDIKPENILLSGGHALVADFGIARAVDAAGDERVTATGLALGTPGYMSPEQAGGARELDGRSDIYSVGCVLYEMLAGEPPWKGPTPQAVIARRFVEAPPSVRRLRDAVPEPLERIVLQALAREPDERFQSAAEFAGAVTAPGMVSTATPAWSTIVTPSTVKPIATRRFSGGLRNGAVALVLGSLVGVGVLLLRNRGPSGAEAAVPKRLAVLPFENLGRSEDEYFSDGITDEVRGKLAALPGIQVTARSSSAQYKKSPKPPSQIGRELRVQYLLTGTVRWEKGTGEQSRVRVSPELVQAATASTTWQEPFEAQLTDVFLVQTEMATRVAEALGIALGAGERERLADRPTRNVAAYDAYLHALEARRTDAPSAAAEFERAIALDSGFALAWAELALTRQYFSSSGLTPWEQIERSRGDAEHALALQPKLPLAYYALGQYFRRRAEYDRALAQYARGLAVAPNDVRLLGGVVEVDLRRGNWVRALETARRLEPLDPRPSKSSPRAMPQWSEAVALEYLRRFPEALAVVNRTLELDSLSPEWYRLAIENLAAQGDLAGARRALDLAERRLGYSEAVVFLGRQYDPQWVLPDSARAFLLRVRPSAMERDTVDWGLTLSLAASSLGDTQRARAYADTARRLLQARRAVGPEGDAPADPLLGAALCLANALAGKAGAARQECEALLERPSPDVLWQEFELWSYARAAVELGDADRAVGALERLARGSGRFTAAWLALDPAFAPLRRHPGFDRLLRQGAT
ncbi:MAG: protein kinase domain-containing protein [Gemmatimonadales bacterium]